MYQNKSIAVVVPAHNEELLIKKVITSLPDFVDKIIIVDDLSSDSTVDQIENLNDPRVILIRHLTNEGVGGAILTGYKKALSEKIDVTAVMAGDAQMDPEELHKIIDPVVNETVDYSKGNRLFSGESWKIMPKYRYIGNAFLSMMTKVASGYWHIADSQTGYTAISKQALETLDLDSIYKKYGFPNDLLIALNIYNFAVKDIPIKSIYNVGEKSGIKLSKVIPRLTYLLTRGFFRRMFHKYIIRDFHPLIFFYLFGMFLFFSGLALAILESYLKITTGKIALPSVVMASLFIISGIQLLLFAMWFDMEYNKSLK